jgi:hypothetical protein
MIGKMSTLVDIYVTEFAPDGMGGYEKSSVFYDQAWAEVKSASAEEREQGLRNADRNIVLVSMHAYEGFPVSSVDVLHINGVKYDVIGKDFAATSDLFVSFRCEAGELNG